MRQDIIDFLKVNWFKTFLVLAIFFSLISASTYFHNKNKLAERKYIDDQIEVMTRASAEGKKVQLFQTCIANAETNYDKNWELGCKDQGKESNCTLPRYIGETLNKEVQDAKEACARVYK